MHSEILVKKIEYNVYFVYFEINVKDHLNKPGNMGSLRFMNLLAVLCCLDALQDLKFFVEQCCYLVDCE